MIFYNVVWGRDGEHGVCVEVAHTEEERLRISFDAVKLGAEFIEIYKVEP